MRPKAYELCRRTDFPTFMMEGKSYSRSKHSMNGLIVKQRACLLKESYDGHIKHRIKPGLGAVKLKALKAPQIEKFYNVLVKGEKLLSPKSIKNVHGVLHRSLQKAVEIGYLSSYPVSACELPRIEKPKIVPFTREQAGDFMKIIGNHKYESFFQYCIVQRNARK